MFAIVTIAGQQFKVRKDDQLFVHRLEGNVGDKVQFSEVLMVSDGNNTSVGGAIKSKVQAEIVNHLKGDKVIVFKKKRRKGYKKRNGHRQYLTQILIEGISATGGKKAAPKKEAAHKVEKVLEEVAAPKKAKAPKAEKATEKVAAPKKAKKTDSQE